MSFYGLPGIGGSLGKCAICGECFAREVIFGESVRTFGIGCIEQTLCAHEKCVAELQAKLGDGELAPSMLPEKSPIRPAIEAAVLHNQEFDARAKSVTP